MNNIAWALYRVITEDIVAQLGFVVNRLFMKLLKTSDINIVRTCQHMFGFELPSVLLDRRIRKFLEKK